MLPSDQPERSSSSGPDVGVTFGLQSTSAWCWFRWLLAEALDPAAGGKTKLWNPFPTLCLLLENLKPLVSCTDGCHRSWSHHTTLPVGITSKRSWLHEQEYLRRCHFASHSTFNSCFLSEYRRKIIIWKNNKHWQANVYVYSIVIKWRWN